MGTSSGTRILFWAWIVSSASCPRSSSDQDASVLRGTTFLAACPDFRLSPVVARRSGSPDSAIDLTPDSETSVQITVNASQILSQRVVLDSGRSGLAIFVSLIDVLP